MTILTAALAVMLALVARAQDVVVAVEATNAPAATTNVVKTPSPIKQLVDVAPVVYNQIRALSLDDGFAVTPFGLRHKGDHGTDWGAGLAVSTTSTNGLNVGVAIASVWENVLSAKTGRYRTELNLYDATLNIQFNGTTLIPFLNWPVDYIAESGPAFNLKDVKTVYEQSFVGVEKSWRMGRYLGAKVFAGEGHFSRWGNGFYQAAGFQLICKPKGW